MSFKKITVCLLLFALCLGVVACTDIDDTDGTSESSSVIESPNNGNGTNEPESSGTSAPESNGTNVPESSGTNVPESSGTDAPESSDTGVPESSGTDAPESSDTQSEETESTDTEETVLEPDPNEPEDTRLSAEYAPVKYFSAADLYWLTKDGVYEDMAQLFFGYDEVTYHKEEGSKPYVKLLAYNDYQTSAEAFISLCTGKMTVAPIFAVKYRTTSAVSNMEIYTDSLNNGVNGKNLVRIPIESDGEWHVEYVNLKSIKDFNGETVNYFRFDFMNATVLPVDSYIEFEYVGFFNSEEEVEMFETGKYVPVVYVDPASGYKESTDIIHASSIDMINGAGGATATKFDYRGGNSLKGIDKFNHNATTLSGGKLVFSGWTVVDGGIEKFVWSIDGITWYDAVPHKGGMGDLGDAHITATQSYTDGTLTDAVKAIKGGGYQGDVGAVNPEDRAKGLACELLKAANVGDKVNVRFAAVPKNAPDQLCLIAYVKNVEIVEEFIYEEEVEEPEVIEPTVDPSECQEHQSSKYWYPVAGELKEVTLCLLCGSPVDERYPAFYSSFDIIEDVNGQKNTGLWGANKTYEKDGSYIVLRGGYDFILQGWFACNGGVKDYVYSVDGGENWLVAGNSNQLSEKFGSAHKTAIKGADLGIANYDVKGMYRVSIPLIDFAAVTEKTVDVLFGAIPANNETVVIPIANITGVKIPKVACLHPDASWTPVEGQLKETLSCEACGETVERDVKFMNNIDKIEGTLNGASHTINPPDGVDLISEPTATITTRLGKDIVVQGWLAVNGGLHKYVYSVDGGETWLDCGNQPNYNDSKFAASQDHINAINGGNLGFTALDADVNGMYRVSCDLSSKAGETVTVILGAILENNRTAEPLRILIVTVDVLPNATEPDPEDPEGGDPEESGSESGTESSETETQTESESESEADTDTEEEIKYLKAINDLVIGGTNIHNPAGGYGGALFTYDAKDITVTSFTVTWKGWAGVNDGFNKWVYSIDGGTTWNDIQGGASTTTDSGILDALSGAGLTNATAKGTFAGGGLVVDISGVTAATVDVIFAAIPNSDTEKVIPMVKIINIKLPNDCTHPGAASWSPVVGELKESGACTRCGETLTRDITYVICLDKVIYNGGSRGWAATAVSNASAPYVVNNVASMPVIDGTGITVQGWVGINGGVSKYMWSIDGETWYDAGSGYYQNKDIPGAVNGYNTGIANVSSGCQFNLNLSGLCNLEVGTYTVYFGAVPANNTSVVVPITQIHNVVVS